MGFVQVVNRPFPSSSLPPLQSESKCEVFLMKISFYSYLLYGSVSRGLGTTKFTDLIG